MSRITYRFCYALFPESGTYPGDAIEGSESTGWSICAAGLIAATMGSTPLSLPNCHFNAAKLDLPLFVIEGEVAHGHLRLPKEAEHFIGGAATPPSKGGEFRSCS